MKPHFVILPVVFSAMIAGAAQQVGAGNDTSPWDKAAGFLVQDAYKQFTEADSMNPDERRFGLAITLLNLQPRTQGNIHEADKLFGEVAANVPPGQPLNALARFFKARLREFYFAEPDAESAKKDYIALVKESTGNPVVELGASRAIIIDAFSDLPNDQILSRLGELEALGQYLKTPAGLREFHTTMAYAILDNNGSKARAVDHFRAADQFGVARKATASRLWLVAAETAAAAGRNADARYFYQKMIDAYPRDPRVYTVRQRLKSLEKNDG